MSVPVLDLTRTTGTELVDALAASSCVFVTGHGLDPAALDALLRTGRAFCALPESDKAAVQWSGEGPWLGWQPVYAGGPSALLLERFEVSLTPGGRSAGLDEWGATFPLWPAHPADMAEAWTEVYAHLHTVASRVTTLVAEGLGLPAADLPAWTERQHSNLVLNHYLAQEEPPEPGRVRQRAHTDIGGITLLWADDTPGGLEARIGPGGTWVPVSFPPGALLVQAGDLLHRWSRGRIPANDHRVVNPPRTGGPQVARYSVVFFHHPDLVTWVAPDGADGQADVEAGVGARDHVLARQRQSGRLDAAQA
jgi:isopenicillin N synthase-like dioxygenase